MILLSKKPVQWCPATCPDNLGNGVSIQYNSTIQ